MAKVADVFGRFEAFCFSILIYVLGYVQMAASTNVQAYASAQIFYSAGSTGLQILQQVFIADSSDLLNRALLALLPELPFLVTVWLGPTIADAMLKHVSWRWGYGMWSIILPASFLPLGLSLLLNQRKARRLNLIKPRSKRRRGVVAILRRTWYDLDIFGLLLLSAAVTLILIPLTLAAKAENGWRNTSIVAMIVVGLVCLLILPLWETSKKLAPKPLLSLHLLKQRTALAGCALAFFYFSMSSLSRALWFILLTQDSGVLFISPTIPIFIPSGCPRVRRSHSRTGDADVRIHFDHRGVWSVNSHQIHWAVPGLRYRGMRDLHKWVTSDDIVPERWKLGGADIGNPDCGGCRRRLAQRAGPVGSPGFGESPGGRGGHCDVSNQHGDGRGCGRGDFWGSVDT